MGRLLDATEQWYWGSSWSNRKFLAVGAVIVLLGCYLFWHGSDARQAAVDASRQMSAAASAR